ncbi:hypothetical protein K438DRAFT_1768656 [Mycena galopus ATCC 62051]|nr:hypothetical protein K438DRAFT_1768656 [Mycena galopus ATCC 62051]
MAEAALLIPTEFSGALPAPSKDRGKGTGRDAYAELEDDDGFVDANGEVEIENDGIEMMRSLFPIPSRTLLSSTLEPIATQLKTDTQRTSSHADKMPLGPGSVELHISPFTMTSMKPREAINSNQNRPKDNLEESLGRTPAVYRKNQTNDWVALKKHGADEWKWFPDFGCRGYAGRAGRAGRRRKARHLPP